MSRSAAEPEHELQHTIRDLIEIHATQLLHKATILSFVIIYGTLSH